LHWAWDRWGISIPIFSFYLYFSKFREAQDLSLLEMANMTEASRINEYANSMFALERFNEKWLNDCTAYIRQIFGDQIVGKTIVDYAFGRGNWSLAFLAAGARNVIAIDASESNISRFGHYLEEKKIKGIELIHGNILEEPLTFRGHIFWLYGIVQNLGKIGEFLSRTAAMAVDDNSLFYIYHYNAPSLRRFIVGTCRSVLRYDTEAEFLDDSFLFIRQARMRARDDLTAPHIAFRTTEELVGLLRQAGLYPMRRDPDFSEFQTGIAGDEFYPHQFLCGMKPELEKPMQDHVINYPEEIAVLEELTSAVLRNSGVSQKNKKLVAIGLFNTHFANLDQGFKVGNSLIEDYLYLLNALLMQERMVGKQVPGSQRLERYRELSFAAMGDTPGRERGIEKIGSNAISDFLCKNRIRL
jgi:hypothetical protein